MQFNWPPIVLRGEQLQRPQGYMFNDDDDFLDKVKLVSSPLLFQTYVFSKSAHGLGTSQNFDSYNKIQCKQIQLPNTRFSMYDAAV